MIGIYKITNQITGEAYIGQSRDIENRFYEHRMHKNTVVGKAIHNYGKENFTFEVLQECTEDKLDELEAHYIEAYNTIETGYNQVPGGKSLPGEGNPNVKVTEEDVYAIREAYNNHERKWFVYQRYKDKLAKGGFEVIWEGKSWQYVHMDVYTPENRQYYITQATKGELSVTALFTDQEVMELRTAYINHSAKELYEPYKDRCRFQTFQQMLWGRNYSHLPIYNKKLKQWVNSQ